MKIRTGCFGYLDNHLLGMIWKDNHLLFCAYDDYIINKYRFYPEQSLISDYVGYRLEAPRNAGIRAFEVHNYAKYQGFDLYVENSGNNMLLVAPLDEVSFFKAYPRKSWHKGWYDSRDPRFEIDEDKVTDIWEERTPIEGFKFDVEPIVYLKKDGVWLVEH